MPDHRTVAIDNTVDCDTLFRADVPLREFGLEGSTGG